MGEQRDELVLAAVGLAQRFLGAHSLGDIDGDAVPHPAASLRLARRRAAVQPAHRAALAATAELAIERCAASAGGQLGLAQARHVLGQDAAIERQRVGDHLGRRDAQERLDAGADIHEANQLRADLGDLIDEAVGQMVGELAEAGFAFAQGLFDRAGRVREGR